MTEPETIEAEVTEQIGQALEVAAPMPVNLVRTEEPTEILRKVTAVADTLKDVLVKQKLVSRIGDRDHVRVEGWALCGTLLGVYARTAWTRKLEDGWEARVEVVAPGLGEIPIGAAEAECLRTEQNWRTRDDYALRSMAQTRATSKALRQPLGFIVQLAGFEPTPYEEMPIEAPERRVEGPPAFPVPRSWAKVRAALETSDEPDAWRIFEAFVRAASYHLYGETDSKKLTADQRKVMLQKAASVAVKLNEQDAGRDGAFAYFGVDVQRAAWASVLDGALLEIPDYVPPEPEVPVPDEDVERIAEETIAGPS